ncbi:MAG: hypothetical protein VX899_17270 [Myxococcota bacterium]|nr:hypothetical protein [Myxococcota bacterium]
MTTILLLLGTGCAPTYTDQYTAMEAVCHWDDYTAAIDAETPGAIWYPTGDRPAFPSEDCLDHISVDLGIDMDAFVAMDELDPYESVNSAGRGYTSQRLGMLLAGLRLLLLYDLGRVDALEPSPLIADAYLEVVEQAAFETDLQSLRATNYNYLTSLVNHVEPVVLTENTSAYARFERATGTLYLGLRSPTPTEALSVLLHEPAHVETFRDHVDCTHHSELVPESGGCDERFDGAYAFSVSGLLTVSGQSCRPDRFRSAAWSALRRVNEANDLEEMNPAWRQDWDQAFPNESWTCIE